jgi:hypothetical protein
MKPVKVRHLLEKHAEIKRIYLAPEGECELVWQRGWEDGGPERRQRCWTVPPEPPHHAYALPLPTTRRPAADPAAYKRRVKAGGNKKPQWTEGWVEFARKRDAKMVAALLNSTPVGACRAVGREAGGQLVCIAGIATCTALTSDGGGAGPPPPPPPRRRRSAEPAGAGRGFYASDLWTLKYLKHFKWHHLTEKIGACAAW